MTMSEEKGRYPWRMPAEWERQRGVLLAWPHAGTDWAPMLEEVLDTYRQMAVEIVGSGELLYVVSPEPLNEPALRSEKVVNMVCPTNDTWARDFGVITLVRGAGSQRTDSGAPPHRCAKMLDFCFNGWGEKFPAAHDNAINRRFFDTNFAAHETHCYADLQDFVLEGGSIESDGRGTVLTTSQCLLAPHRNQPMTRHDIEERLKRDLCAQRILWIDHGHLTGDDTDGHIDTLVRICPNDTLLYVGCNDPDDEQYAELKAMEAQLQTFTTPEGQPYRLRKLPMPAPIHDEEGLRLPATYANFLILNDRVLLPTYGQPQHDQAARQTVQEAFPDRRVIGIDSRSLIKQHGSIHCCTMQIPQ